MSSDLSVTDCVRFVIQEENKLWNKQLTSRIKKIYIFATGQIGIHIKICCIKKVIDCAKFFWMWQTHCPIYQSEEVNFGFASPICIVSLYIFL